ncbi:dipeptidyl aminopeptidase/acylaminoacyl peptidase [Archangium gephyra]|uniref:Dipeptidyl aminopeptidase/acylaminoacyl peptidase n=1 Tax=Archangium gephyra TaxID=48 RepID=A0AAC8QI52_9BACT|nr:prolyl oligopeptidase family serine peptidase [Archangium gephyra]AKJ08137.1 prolyl oligopeptidase family protein [Archangium gephyra]REG29871.1 dipeptidyl aminopeptidase/acylaminoacyl peptidase [Archangium gephyra]
MTLASREAPYGSWKSPITADMIATQTLSLGEVAVDGDDVYWLEVRPSERGRHALVRRSVDGTLTDVLPPVGEGRVAYSSHSLVYGHGGGSFAVSEGLVIFVNHASTGMHVDQRLYRVNPGRTPVPLTADTGGKHRFGDLVMDRTRNRVVCVREDWRNLKDGQPRASLVAVDLDGQKQTVLAEGRDFYSSPTLSPNGRRMAWLAWDYPCMPWDGCELWVADVDELGALHHPRLVAGGTTESIFQPEWSPQGELYFVSDRNNWWNLYRLQGRSVVPVLERKAEFGAAQWQLGMSTYAFISPRHVVCAFNEQGQWKLGRLDVVLGQFAELATRFTDVSQVRGGFATAYFVGGGPEQPASVVRLDMESGKPQVLKASTRMPEELVPYLSRCEPLHFPTTELGEAHAWYYPPTHPDHAAPAGEKPPLLIMSHGGPTASASTKLDWTIQYFTSRGFAVVDVNYRGSTGYGREYRLSLYGNWGVMDVDDCANAALRLVQEGKVDARRLVARGGGTGGYTTLSLLAFRDILRCGTSASAVANLETLVEHVEKFEAHYMDQVLGPQPESRQLLQDRSPCLHLDNIKRSPVLFIQARLDGQTSQRETEEMMRKLRANGVPTAMLPVDGEPYGPRITTDTKKALEAELAFYSQVMSLRLAEPLEPVALEPTLPEGPRR